MGRVGCRESPQADGELEEMKRERSHKLFERARQLMPGGVNSPARAFGGVGYERIWFEERGDAMGNLSRIDSDSGPMLIFGVEGRF